MNKDQDEYQYWLRAADHLAQLGVARATAFITLTVVDTEEAEENYADAVAAAQHYLQAMGNSLEGAGPAATRAIKDYTKGVRPDTTPHTYPTEEVKGSTECTVCGESANALLGHRYCPGAGG